MRKNLLTIGLAAALAAASGIYASPRGDMEFLGYSQELMDDALKATSEEDEIAKVDATLENMPDATEEIDEATALQQQLVELANTRSIRADMSDRTLDIKNQIDSYWNKMSPDRMPQDLPEELRHQVTSAIQEALTVNGYSVIQLELLDLPDGSNKDRFRAVIRVTRPVQTKNPYQEIQKNLGEIKKICSEAATIDGVNYLSELTTFVAENPKNKYYYEKTILKY